MVAEDGTLQKHMGVMDTGGWPDGKGGKSAMEPNPVSEKW